MKSKMKRRMLAIVLCMVIALSNSSFIFASSGTEEPAAVAQEGDPQNVQETQTEAAVQDTPAVLSETTPEATPEATPEPTQVPEVTAAPTEAPETTAEPTQAPEVTATPETTPEATPVPTETPAVTAEPTQAPEVTAAPETTPEATPVPTEAPVTYNEAVELRHEFKDENGNVTATVTAQIPAGAFQADVSELTMEVTVPDQATTEHVKKLMEESLPEHYMLGDTVLYDIRFKVNGTETESQQPIVITFENQNGITVRDVKKAVVFQLDPADPAVEGDKDELVTITQRNDMIESLQNSGQSTDNVDDYDLSEITLKEDGTSNKIQMEGRTSTIYGCYAYYEPVQVLTYEDDQVTVTVSAAENGVIPANAELKVVPITEDKETEDQYKDVEKKLQEKAEEEEYEIAGFLAYDITFVDPDGNETEPNGEVKVSIDYKEAAIPESISEEDAQNAEVTVLHLEENEKGDVKEVVDMAQNEKIDVLATTEEKKVEKAEVKTESFSIFTITWYYGNYGNFTINMHYVYEENGQYKNILDEKELEKYTGNLKDFLYNNDTKLNLTDYQLTIPGYTYLKTTADSENGTEISSLTKDKNDGWWGTQYYIKHNKNSYSDYWLSSGDKTEGDIYFIYKKDDSSSSGGGSDDGTSTLGTPDHKKYIKQNTIDNYTLSLDVTGKVGETLPIDILLIIDKSGSMAEDDDRYLYVNSAINKLKAALKDSETEINIAAVTFSSAGNSEYTSESDNAYQQNDNKVDAWTAKDWQKLGSFSFQLTDEECSGGTNWQAGVRKGEELLAERAGVASRKYVLFLTDGDPTYRYLSGSKTITQGTGGSDPNGRNYNAAVTEWKSSPNLNSANTTKYVIDATKKGSDKCSKFATAIGGTRLKGSSNSEMTNAFQEIAEDILKPVYKNVYIQDTLSEYVTFADPLNLKVSNSDGETLTLNVDYTYSIEGQTITVYLLRKEGSETGGELAQDVTYTISYNIITTQKAVDEFINNGGYTDTGDEGTDVPELPEDLWTSSGKPGFYSNDKAVVKYQENDGPERTAEYQHPVVQIDTESIDIPEEPNPVDGSITKTMGVATEQGYPITLEVKTRLEETSENANVDVIFVIDTSNSMTDNGATRLKDTKNAAKAFVNGFVGQEGFISTIHRVGIVTFGTNATKVLDFTGDVDEIVEAIDQLSSNGGTNTAAGLKMAKELADSEKDPTHQKYVIFLTDGVPTYGGDDGNTGRGYSCYAGDYNAAVDAANDLKNSINGIYTVGLLNGMGDNSRKLQIARRLLAAPKSTGHFVDGYTECYKVSNTGSIESGSIDWDKTKDKTYSSGYFEIRETEGSDTALKAIWEQLATIINNQTAGATGDGWIVTDQMAEYTSFKALDGSSMNGHELTLSDDEKSLTTILENQSFTVAKYSEETKTITWYLNSELAEQSIKYNHGVDYTYRLTYYVTFEDSTKTELRPTNSSTYVTPTGNKDKIYPDKMPFFVNVIGNKVDAENTNQKLANATFNVYKDENRTQLLTTMTSDENGHFAFQLGQSDFTMESQSGDTPEAYSMTVYLEEVSAPEGYVADTVLHPVTIRVSNVIYASQNQGNVQKGSPSGSVSIEYTSEGSDDKLSVDSTGTLYLVYKNESRPAWGIVKRNGNKPEERLSGAEFELYELKEEDVASEASYRGVSDNNGVIDKWVNLKTEESINGKFIKGEYVLRETKAPEGYSLSTVQWKIKITDTDVIVSMYNSSGSNPQAVSEAEKTELNLTGNYYYYDNVMLYELPNTGGSGIFWYLISGTAFMMAASLILYRMKRKEVLGR